MPQVLRASGVGALTRWFGCFRACTGRHWYRPRCTRPGSLPCCGPVTAPLLRTSPRRGSSVPNFRKGARTRLFSPRRHDTIRGAALPRQRRRHRTTWFPSSAHAAGRPRRGAARAQARAEDLATPTQGRSSPGPSARGSLRRQEVPTRLRLADPEGCRRRTRLWRTRRSVGARAGQSTPCRSRRLGLAGRACHLGGRDDRFRRPRRAGACSAGACRLGQDDAGGVGVDVGEVEP